MSGVPLTALVIRQISHASVLERYLKDEYHDACLPERRRFSSLVGTSGSGIISRTTTNGRYSIALSNLKLAEDFERTGIYAPTGGQCLGCRDVFKHPGMGVFVHRDGKFIFCDGLTCSFECTLGITLWGHQWGMMADDPLYQNSESLLLGFFRRFYPGKRLTKLSDPRIFHHNGGAIDVESIELTPWPLDTEFILVPIKVEYQIVEEGNYTRTNLYLLPDVEKALKNRS